ncbi:endonuclease/exonuclease/phosphatase family protein [Psychroserpens sp. BH13MA-6]
MKLLIAVCFFVSTISMAQTYKIMSYNIKLDYPKKGENSWTNRKNFLTNQIKFHEPDVLGVQEAMPNQMTDLDSLLVTYSFVGVGRDDGNDEGEYSALFYKTEKFEIVTSGTFWLSETPELVSMGWDAVCHRICTYALLKDRKTNKRFWVFNTHFDHVGTEARKESAQLILEKINAMNNQDDPIILTGDFNMEPTHESINSLKNKLHDSKEIATIQFGPEGTFNGFHFDQPVSRRIDYIFVSDDVTVDKYAVLSDNWNLKYPSDHFPVIVALKF